MPWFPTHFGKSACNGHFIIRKVGNKMEMKLVDLICPYQQERLKSTSSLVMKVKNEIENERFEKAQSCMAGVKWLCWEYNFDA